MSFLIYMMIFCCHKYCTEKGPHCWVSLLRAPMHLVCSKSTMANTSFSIRTRKELNFLTEYFFLFDNKNYIIQSPMFPCLSWLQDPQKEISPQITVMLFSLIVGKFELSCLLPPSFPFYFYILLCIIFEDWMLEMKSLFWTCMTTIVSKEICQKCTNWQLCITWSCDTSRRLASVCEAATVHCAA